MPSPPFAFSAYIVPLSGVARAVLHYSARDQSRMAIHSGSPSVNLPTNKGKRLELSRFPGSPNPEDIELSTQWVLSQPRPWGVDLFAGAGGLSLGLKHAGISMIAAAEKDTVPAETHAANIGGLTWVGDLTDSSSFVEFLKQRGVLKVDLVAGGPPCQPFSNAGLAKIRSLEREAIDDRTGLWKSYFEVIDQLSPSIVLLENVPAFSSAQEGATLAAFIGELESRGFEAHARVVEAWRYGVPQHRKRLFVVATRAGLSFRWPRTIRKIHTLQDAIGDLPTVAPGHREETMVRRQNPRSPLAKRLGEIMSADGTSTISDHITRDVRTDDAEIFALMRPGQTYADVPEDMRRYRSDIFDDKYTRLSWGTLSRSITAHIAKDGYWYIHPQQDRTLSIREAARVQTFPDWFRFAGYPSNRLRQIGNAVPPILAEAIGKSIVRTLAESDTLKGASHETRISTRAQLDRWYHQHGRSFIWRRFTDPWAILLAEVCLHRTKADQVASILPALLYLAPTPTDMLANEIDVRKVTTSLGLKWRINNLFQIAEILAGQHGGKVPTDWESLRGLPGVGDYIASAVLCFAFGTNAVLLDTNTNRIAKRMLGNPKAGQWEIRLALQRMSRPGGPNRDWNFGLLDLGELICTSRNPSCSTCPIRFRCSTGRQTIRRTSRSDRISGPVREADDVK